MKTRVKALKILTDGIAFKVSDISALDDYAKYVGKDLDGFSLELKKPYRTNNANAYMWHLCREIAEASYMADEEVYKHAIRSVGVRMLFSDLSEDEANRFIDEWSNKGLGWFCEKDITPNTVMAYYGSSCYRADEMARLIDFLVDEAEFYGIPTKRQEEINRLVEEWAK